MTATQQNFKFPVFGRLYLRVGCVTIKRRIEYFESGVVIMQQRHPANPLLQRIKGVFVFKKGWEDLAQKAPDLLKTLHCDVLSSRDNRVTISTSRGNLQNIKQCWLSNDAGNALSQQLKDCVEQIIIGGTRK